MAAFARPASLFRSPPRTAGPARPRRGCLPHDLVQEPRRRGHDVEVARDWSLGRLSAAGRDPRTGFLKAAANPRGMQGYAVGR